MQKEQGTKRQDVFSNTRHAEVDWNTKTGCVQRCPGVLLGMLRRKCHLKHPTVLSSLWQTQAVDKMVFKLLLFYLNP